MRKSGAMLAHPPTNKKNKGKESEAKKTNDETFPLYTFGSFPTPIAGPSHLVPSPAGRHAGAGTDNGRRDTTFKAADDTQFQTDTPNLNRRSRL